MVNLFEVPARFAEFEIDHIISFNIRDPLGDCISTKITDEQMFWESTGNYLLYVDAAKGLCEVIET